MAKLHSNKLERKLANSNGQVVELVNLVCQMKEENTFLSYEANTYRQALQDISSVVKARA